MQAVRKTELRKTFRNNNALIRKYEKALKLAKELEDLNIVDVPDFDRMKRDIGSTVKMLRDHNEAYVSIFGIKDIKEA